MHDQPLSPLDVLTAVVLGIALGLMVAAFI